MNTIVVKRDGSKEPFCVQKLLTWTEWAAEGLDVDPLDVATKCMMHLGEEISSLELHEMQMKTFSALGTEAGLVAAGRLFIGNLRKKLYGKSMTPPPLWEIYQDLTAKGLWKFSHPYSKSEIDEIEAHIDYAQDLKNTITQSRQIVERYAVKDILSKRVYETPQLSAMRVALGGMAKMPKDRRVEDVISLYKLVKASIINIPSPFYSYLGTPTRQGASCCVLTANDTAVSIAVQSYIAEMMTVAGAGIGAHLMCRSKGDSVRGGAIVHQGKTPYYRHSQTAVLANKQGSRGGAMTMAFSCLDPEFFDIMRLKNVKTPLEAKVKDIDYAFGYNNSFVRHVSQGKPWMLVSYAAAPRLHHLLYAGTTDEFDKEFERVFNDKSIKKKILPSRSILHAFLREAVETGRYYEYNATWMNFHTPFKDVIHSSNLCMEIALATKAFPSMPALYSNEDEGGEIALCSLAAIAAGRVGAKEYEHVAYYTLLLIDNVIEDMDYPFPSLRRTALARRSVGVGVTDFAHAMAERGLKWDSDAGKEFAFATAELHSYALHKAAIRLTQERGVCAWASRTKYADGWLPRDTANPIMQAKWGHLSAYDWEAVRAAILALGGLRFSVLEAHMPCESSSVASYHTNGLYPIRQGKVIKPSGATLNVFIAPGWDRLAEVYDIAYNIPHDCLVEYYAIFQMHTGQAISADLYIRHSKTGRRKVSLTELVNNWIYRNMIGMKTRYYYNSSTETTVSEKTTVCDTCTL
jgi:ribonucleoside-diphosphate reductase alpha subunit